MSQNWTAPEDQIRAALYSEPEESQPLTPDQEAYLLAQGYMPHDLLNDGVSVRARIRDDRLLKHAPAEAPPQPERDPTLHVLTGGAA